MSITPSSKTRLASVDEVTIGTTPSSPSFKTMRFLSHDLRMQKTTEIPDEIRSDRNVSSIVDVGRMVTGGVKTNLSYGTFDDWFRWLLNAAWQGDVLTNGSTPKAGTIETLYRTDGGQNLYIRHKGVRVNTLDMVVEARKAVTCDWGFMGLTSSSATSALSGATYADPTTTPIFNAGLNVTNLSITDSPSVRRLSLKVTNNLTAVDVIGQYDPYGHVLGRFEVSGSMECLFESLDVYQAILDHDTIAVSFRLEDSLGNSYEFQIPKAKLLDGGPVIGGNGQAVMIDVPFQAFYSSVEGGSLLILRGFL